MDIDNLNEVFDGAFRIIGEDLDPEYITAFLGMKPDYSHKKGDASKRVNSSGKTVIGPSHKTGIWSINSELPETSSLEEHISWLLEKLALAGEKVKELSQKGYRVDIYCGHFLKHGFQGGFNISPGVLEKMGKMGIILAIGTYEM